MSDIIHLLPDSVANQIAAGEVIQRPASVIKELVENSIDAGATQIDVLVTDSGRTSIQVIDNGKGMSETDARMSFERHATSKIKDAADLFNLRTMGFRGEALASIAAVAEVELKTRTEADELGVRILISGSRLEKQEVVSVPKGTNFTVRNLFFNVPARRKFLKSNSTELSNIMAEFERIVLVHPDVAFSLHSNGSELFNLPVQSTHRRILSVFGQKTDQQLLPLKVETSIVTINGFVAKPEFARKKGAHQFFFVNGRYMRHPYFHKAVMDAYDQLIPAGEQLSYFIFFEVDPANIDVNIHPTKAEIKFENEQGIWQILSAAVKESLGKFSAVPTLEFSQEPLFDEIPALDANQRVAAPPKLNLDPTYNPFKNERPSTYSRSKVDRQWEQLYNFAAVPDEQQQTSPADEPARLPLDADEPARAEVAADMLQYKGRYILTSMPSGLVFIDQHRAHVRVLFERYMKQISERYCVSQGLLFPEMVQFSPSEQAILEDILSDMQAVGFELTPLGGGSYAINGMPAGVEGLDPASLLRNMVHTAMEGGSSVKAEVQQVIAQALAKAAAIVYGQVLSAGEMTDLVNQLFQCATPGYTPDGQPVLVSLKDDEIGRLFAR